MALKDVLVPTNNKKSYDNLSMAIKDLNTTGVTLKGDKTKTSLGATKKTEQLPPLAPKAEENKGPSVPQVKTQLKYQRYFDDNVILINPIVDCSDKELHQRNGFKSTGENLYSFLKNGDKATFVDNVFKPKRLGELTKDNFGVVKMISNAIRPQNFNKHVDIGATTQF